MIVAAEPVIKQLALIILVFGREPERVGLGHGAGGAEEFPEGAVFVAGGKAAVGGVGESGHISIAVISHGVTTDRGLPIVHEEQAAHATSADTGAILTWPGKP